MATGESSASTPTVQRRCWPTSIRASGSTAPTTWFTAPMGRYTSLIRHLGCPKFFSDPRKELPYSGVFSVKDGKLQLVSTDLTGPNGIAFSPDEKYLYVTNWEDKRKVILRYKSEADGTVSEGMTFFDMTSAPGEDSLDGMKVDVEGNLYVSGPGGVWIISPEGKQLGIIITPRHPHN